MKTSQKRSPIKARGQTSPTAKASISFERTLPPNDWRTQPLDGRWVVCMLADFFTSYAILPQGLPLVLALWVIGSQAFGIFDVFPYLCVTSPLKRCGKTRLAELLELLCPRALNSVNITEAALFRTIDQLKPVLIMDEAETLANRRAERSQYLLALLQAGFKQGAVVPRCVGRGRDIEYFSVFCPKVVLAIGNLPDTLLDRSIHIVMQRKRPGQHIDQFRRRAAKDQANGPYHATLAWCKAHRETVARAYRKQHIDFLQDREADIWEPIFATASVAVPSRIEELKQTALRLSGEKRKLDTDETEGLRLLTDVRRVFDNLEVRRIHTDRLLQNLRELPESAWDELTSYKLARLLRPFEISSRQVWIDEKNRRGYELEDFTMAFERYVPKR